MATDRSASRGDEGECRVALVHGGVKEEWQVVAGEGDSCCKLGRRVWEESKKLWVIVAPAMFSRVVTYGMNVITQAFAGHLGDLELAAISIANTVVVGLNFGLMAAARTSGLDQCVAPSQEVRGGAELLSECHEASPWFLWSLALVFVIGLGVCCVVGAISGLVSVSTIPVSALYVFLTLDLSMLRCLLRRCLRLEVRLLLLNVVSVDAAFVGDVH